MNRPLRRLVTSTSRRNFVTTPAVVALEQVAARRRVDLRWTLLLLWGYAQYRWAGDYRNARGGGGPGQSGPPPERLVDTGPYAWTRNPMYLGHLVFLTGLTLTTRSPLAALALVGNIPWFDRHARRDEERLTELFGQAYLDYREHVPRWLPRRPR
ncbi:MAG: isoprenylcysteine carboxylmethyltransferase family protein [Actinobacteria bacterium]|nr:isoprenylcysteine carboxylmethyltransferase family protein [Actinomycetota bacterium]MBW3658533.1 isoprenylcysteine carboxylmethyltransferase family protein [Actinomycetota bacterium]